MIKIIGLLMVVLAAGCGQKSSSDIYLERLSNVLQLDHDYSEYSIVQPPSLPTMRDRLVSAPVKSSISVREFLSLKECELHQVLAHRNSSFGKVAAGSQLFLNDLDIIRTAPACIAKVAAIKPDLAEKLRTLLDSKRRDLAFTFAQALIAGKEYTQFWSLSHQLTDYPNNVPANIPSSLVQLAQWANDPSMVDAETFEVRLGEVRYGDGGLLLRHIAVFNSKLRQATQMIQSAAAKPLCYQANRPTKSTYFATVVNQFFINDLQRQAQVLLRRSADLLTPIMQIESTLHAHLSETYRQWIVLRDRNVANLKQELKQHVGAIQVIYKQCGIRVGG
ncbi:MAG: DUF3080 family protein [Pseudomonadota bacterium]